MDAQQADSAVAPQGDDLPPPYGVADEQQQQHTFLVERCRIARVSHSCIAGNAAAGSSHDDDDGIGLTGTSCSSGSGGFDMLR